MDAFSQQELQPEKEAKPMRTLLQVLLPASILPILLSFCVIQTIDFSSITNILEHLVNKKALFLFCNSILLFLATDFSLGGSSAFVNDLHDEYLRKLGGHLPSQSSGAIVVEEEVVEEKATKGHRPSPSDAVTFEAHIASSERAIGRDSERADELPVRNTRYDPWWQSDSMDVDEEVVEEKRMIGDAAGPLEVISVGGAEDEGMELVGVKDEMELLTIEELNKKFDEFIEGEKRKRRLEALQLIMV